MNYGDWSKKLTEYFAHIDRDDNKWEETKTSLQKGDTVSGIVICKAHFGAWIDIGVGFPALLEILYIDGLIPSQYHADNWCQEGSTIHAFVLGFRDNNKQIYLTQKRSSSEK